MSLTSDRLRGGRRVAEEICTTRCWLADLCDSGSRGLLDVWPEFETGLSVFLGILI